MTVDLQQIGVQTALILAILAGIGLYVRYKVFPELKDYAEMAPVRFWKTLSEKAGEEGVDGTGATGRVKLGGFEMDVGTIKELMKIAPQLIQLAQSFGLIKGGGGGESPFTV